MLTRLTSLIYTDDQKDDVLLNFQEKKNSWENMTKKNKIRREIRKGIPPKQPVDQHDQ